MRRKIRDKASSLRLGPPTIRDKATTGDENVERIPPARNALRNAWKAIPTVMKELRPAWNTLQRNACLIDNLEDQKNPVSEPAMTAQRRRPSKQPR